MSEMKYGIGFPAYYKHGPGYINKVFEAYRAWLEKTVGPQKEGWDWITGDLHANGIVFKKKSDLTAFILKFNIGSP